MSLHAAETAVRDGDLTTALEQLQEQIRREPGAANLRVFLFQLLAVAGQWERAQTQLNVAGDLDASTLAMVQMYRETIRCEMLRTEVFAGRRSPMIFGEPDRWLALLIESLLVAGAGRPGDSRQLREQAFELAPTSSGTVDSQPFEWIADADMRLGPVCEAIINGRYYWLPFARLSRIQIEPPVDLRDFVWIPAQFGFVNGGEAVGVIPTRYPGSERAEDDALRLGRRTQWVEETPEVFRGLGQRIITTDHDEYALMDIRSIDLTAAPAEGDARG